MGRQNSKHKGRKILLIVSAVIITVIIIFLISGWLFLKGIAEEINSNMNTHTEQVSDLEKDNAFLRSHPDVLWNTLIYWGDITTGKLDGFSPKIALSEKSEGGQENCKVGSGSLRESSKYLRVEGGICGVGYFLIDSKGGRIDSLEKLKIRFAPVESEDEAVSFVAATTEDLEMDKSGVPEGHTIKNSAGFLVQVVRKNTFGCGPHTPSRIIFRVSGKGDIAKLAEEKAKSTGGHILCVD